MFDILEADIVIFQETKIQRKDLRDDMVLVPGWDCFFSLPKHKKGYSGVVIYTRQSVCSPIRAEEGITGILCPPNSSTSFSGLPNDQQIGGYPTAAQASKALDSSCLATDFAALDSEGRCVIVEFPAFVLLGVYSPANRDETRDDFRLGFLNLLDARVRNLVAMGKRVFLTGDLNVSKDELDTANAESTMRKSNMNAVEYFSTPARQLFNHLLEDGKVFGDKDAGREQPVLWDICRGFHPTRRGMFTCWEQKVNARPANFGARIDYVLCSLDMKAWFSDSNIQEGLMGSDHCPVYAVMKDTVFLDGEDTNSLDVMNPEGMFHKGQRLREHTIKDMLPLSGKLIPEFDRRQNIRDMFKRKPSLSSEQSRGDPVMLQAGLPLQSQNSMVGLPSVPSPERTSGLIQTNIPNTSATNKRALGEIAMHQTSKRTRPGIKAVLIPGHEKAQQSLVDFLTPKDTWTASSSTPFLSGAQFCQNSSTAECTVSSTLSPETHQAGAALPGGTMYLEPVQGSCKTKPGAMHDPIESKESWSKLFTKPVAPRCEGHGEPCISLKVTKSGMNSGRYFWICPRPIGPNGTKEKGTQWRCQTFIWCSDWNTAII
ncbi:Class II abasic (AP) endonuclease [Lambiella insularis]|nr:Class II abasic (AP) endonuclease [Lambiella insularis]